MTEPRDRRPTPDDAPARAEAPAPAKPGGERLMSLDALRGFDMFWIIGAEGFVMALDQISDAGVVKFIAGQLSHKTWAGFSFFDLIFPLFIFMVGVSIVLALDKARQRNELRPVLRKILVRTALLIFFGIIYSQGGLRNGWDQVRWLNVLQRIGIAYCVTSILFIKLRTRTLLMVTAGILVGYWALLTFVPVRNISLERTAIAQQEQATGLTARELFDRTDTWVSGTEAFAPGRNLPNHVDFQYLPGRKYDGHYDPEGLLSTIPAVASCLLGMFAGLLLRRRERTDLDKVKLLIGAGLASLAAGWLWGLHLPIIKQLWTPSFVLWAGGWSAILLGVFVYVIDLRGHRRWAIPFVWIGMNPIAIYLARNFCDFNALAERVLGGPVKDALGVYGQAVIIAGGMALSFLFCWYLYRRRIFIRL